MDSLMPMFSDGGCLMELLFWLVVGGLLGTVFMDFADKSMARVGFTTGAA